MDNIALHYKHSNQTVFSFTTKVNSEGRITFATSGVKEILDYVPNELLGSPIEQYFVREDFERIRLELVNTNKEYIKEICRMIHRSGRYVETIFEIVIIRYPNSCVPNEYVCTVFDNSLATSIENSESLFSNHLVVENSIDAIGIVQDNKWIYVNPACTTLFESPKHEILLRPVLDFVHTIDKLRFQSILDQVVASEKILKDETFFFITVEGHELVIDVVFLPTTFNGKRATQIIFRDITELKKAEEIFLQHEKLTAIGHLAAGIAHDIKNPLTSLKGFVDLMLNGIGNSKTYLEVMKSELKQIEHVSRELMTLAKPLDQNYQIHNIINFIEDVILLIDTEAFRNNIQIHKELPSSELLIKGEDTQIKQVMLNIIKNGIESMTEGGLITISAANAEDKIQVKIRDEGCGIPPEQLSKIGKPFYTTKETGNGLGLMMSYRIIEQHGGSIVVNSKVGEGTEFIIQLPSA